MSNQTLVNDMTQGSVFSKLVRFAMPLMIANTLQVGFNLVDMYFVGHYIGTDALSAVSIAGQLIMVVFAFYVGLASCGQILTAQTVGAGNRGRLNKIIGNVITLSIITGLLTTLVIPLGRPIFRLMNTPAEIMDDTYIYMVILCSVNVLVCLYNGLCGVLRGMGDSKHPTQFIAIATIVNIILDYVFIVICGWGVKGAGFATLIGQSSAAVFAIFFLYRHKDRFGFDFKLASFKPEFDTMRTLLKLGIPATAKQLCINMSMLYVNVQINELGVIAVALNGVSSKLVNVMSIASHACVDSTASMVGQNIAAGKEDRVKSTVWNSLIFNVIFGVVISVIFLVFPTQIFGLFSSEPEVIAQAPAFMKVAVVMIITFMFMSPTMGLIIGVGNANYNLVMAIIDGVIARIFLSILFGRVLGMGAIGFFLGNASAGFVSDIMGWGYYATGIWKWKKYLKE